MALSESLLGGLIAVAIPVQIQSMFPTAIPMPIQTDFAMACAKGFVSNIKGSAKGVGAAGLPMAGTGIGINGISATKMSAYALQKFQEKLGSSGPAAKPFLDAIFEPTVKHLALTQVISLTGFGGPLLKVTNLIPDKVAQDIEDALPAQVRENLKKSRAGRIFIDAIAYGFCQEITTVGIPGAIPMAGLGAGPTMAFFL